MDTITTKPHESTRGFLHFLIETPCKTGQSNIDACMHRLTHTYPLLSQTRALIIAQSLDTILEEFLVASVDNDFAMYIEGY